MIDVDKLKRLSVGDIVEFQRHKEDERKKELIATIKELYGENVPADKLDYIEQQIKALPKITEGGALSLEEIQYMVWMSLRKTDTDATLKQVGDWLDMDKFQEYIAAILPQEDSVAKKKKVTRKPKHKDN